MQMRITDAYHIVRLEEIELTADYLMKKEEEREALELNGSDFGRSVRLHCSWLRHGSGLRRRGRTSLPCLSSYAHRAQATQRLRRSWQPLTRR